MSDRLILTGYKEFLRAVAKADRDTKRIVRQEMRQAGRAVRDDAANRLKPFSQRSADGLKVRVRQRGVEVEQSLRRTTGLHPRWGELQMRRDLLPAARAKGPLFRAELERAFDRIAARLNNIH